MVACDQLKIDRLAKKIRSRQQFLNRIVNRIIDLVRKHGRVIRRDQANNHIRIISELRNFRNFTFETDLGQTDFGGNTIKVWYHPRKNFREGGLDFAWDKEWTPVLNVYFQVDEDYRVSIFKDNVDWQKALLGALKNKIRKAAQIKNKQEEALKKQEQEDAKKVKLVSDAQKLGIR